MDPRHEGEEGGFSWVGVDTVSQPRAETGCQWVGRREAAGTNPDDRDVVCAFRLDLSASQKLFLREDWAKRASFSSDTQEPPYGRASRRSANRLDADDAR